MDKLILSELDQRTEHCMDVACSHAGILHAAGICTGRSRFYKSEKYGQHADEELGRLHVRQSAYWFIGFGLMFGMQADSWNAPHFFDLRSTKSEAGLPRRFPDIPDCILRNGCHHRVRRYGRTYQILHVSGLHHLYQCTDLSVSGHWTWGGGWLMNGDEGSFMMSDIRHYFP